MMQEGRQQGRDYQRDTLANWLSIRSHDGGSTRTPCCAPAPAPALLHCTCHAPLKRGSPPPLCIARQVELPTADLTGFLCAEDSIRHPFKYKSLRAACCNLPNAKELGNICTKVRVTA